jgi:hypothetical protein
MWGNMLVRPLWVSVLGKVSSAVGLSFVESLCTFYTSTVLRVFGGLDLGEHAGQAVVG